MQDEKPETHHRITFLTSVFENWLKENPSIKNEKDQRHRVLFRDSIINQYLGKAEFRDILPNYFDTARDTVLLRENINAINKQKELIEKLITSALEKCGKSLRNDSVEIFILPSDNQNDSIIKLMKGVSGVTAGSKQIILNIYPNIANWQTTLTYATAHEYHHAFWIALTKPGKPPVIPLDRIILEGRADHFASSLYPDARPKWTTSYTEKELDSLWTIVKPNLKNERLSDEIMFGSKTFPVWSGYNLGFRICSKAFNNMKEKNYKAFALFPTDSVLKLAAFN